MRREAGGQGPATPVAPSPSPAAESPYGLCSKDDFGLSLGRRLAEWRRRGSAPALLMMRIDDFPAQAKRYGPEIIALVLRSAMQFLAASIRAMDLGSQYSDDTFAMLLPGASTTELIRVAERLRQAVARCVLPIEGQSVQFTVSLAGAVAIQTDTTEEMIARVESTLQQVAAGRRQLHVLPQRPPGRTGPRRAGADPHRRRGDAKS